MLLRSELKEVLKNIQFSLYPIAMLYLNFVFLGIFILGRNEISKAPILLFFIVFNLILALCILYYVLLSTSDNKSTNEIFPPAIEAKYERNYAAINPFVKEAILAQSVEKTHMCDICKTYKPPRCHHCTKCNKCFLRFDRHLAFFDECISFYNYKYFVQFLTSNLLLIIAYIVFVNVEFGLFEESEKSILVNLIISDVLAVIFLFENILLVISTFKTLSRNETLVEYLAINQYLEGDHRYKHVFQEGPIVNFSFSKERKILNPYNLGAGENFKEIMGKNLWEWISPSFTTSGDGISFKKNTHRDENS